jgi:hypothetical protein
VKRKAGHLQLSVKDADRVHAEQCTRKAGECLQCLAAEQKHRWSKRFTWLVTGFNPKVRAYALGCKVCKEAGCNTLWGRQEITRENVRITSLLQHRATKFHVKAKKHSLKDQKILLNGKLTPSSTSFRKVLNDFRMNRVAGAQGVHGVGKKNKLRKMLFCLAEASRECHRQFLAKAGSISLHQDGRKGKLVIRYRACTDQLARKDGCLGQADLAQDFGHLGATAIAKGTMQVLRNMCTRRRWAPVAEDTRMGFDKSLFNHLKSITELIDTDAAADERRAGKLLQHGSAAKNGAAAIPAEFENLKGHNLDKCHGTRRRSLADQARLLRGTGNHNGELACVWSKLL